MFQHIPTFAVKKTYSNKYSTKFNKKKKSSRCYVPVLKVCFGSRNTQDEVSMLVQNKT